MRLKRNLFLAFTLLWLLDATFTTMFILQYGVEMEANPFLRDLIAKFGLSALWAIKAIAWLGWYGANKLYERKRGKSISWAIDAGFVAILIPVCVMGFRVAFGV